MGTIADKLQKLLSTKEAIKQAIINKGVSVDDSDTFFSYASKISEIQGEGGGSSDEIILADMDCSYLFYGGARYEQIDKIKLIRPRNIKNLMYAAKKITELNWKDVDFSYCTDYTYAFYNTALTMLDIKVSTENCTTSTLSNICNSSAKLETVNMSEWETSKATSFSLAFAGCTSLKSLDFSSCDFSSCTSVSSMIQRCTAIESIVGLNFPAIDTTSYLNFIGSTNLTNLKTIKFKENGVFADPEESGEVILNLTRATAFDADGYVNMINSLGINETGYVRTIKLYTNLYNSLTDEQKALATNKNYNLSYGTS